MSLEKGMGRRGWGEGGWERKVGRGRLGEEGGELDGRREAKTKSKENKWAANRACNVVLAIPQYYVH